MDGRILNLNGLSPNEQAGVDHIVGLMNGDFYKAVGGNGPFGKPPGNMMTRGVTAGVTMLANGVSGTSSHRGITLGRTEEIRAKNNLFWSAVATVGFGVFRKMLPVSADTLMLRLCHAGLTLGTLYFNDLPAIFTLAARAMAKDS